MAPSESSATRKLAPNGLRGSAAELESTWRWRPVAISGGFHRRLQPERSSRPRAANASHVLTLGHTPQSRTAQKPPISPVCVRAPRLETSLLVVLIRKVDVGPAVQQIPQVQSNPRQVHRVDLEIAPIERPVGIVGSRTRPADSRRAGSPGPPGTLNRICCRRTAGRPLSDGRIDRPAPRERPRRQSWQQRRAATENELAPVTGG